MTKKRLGLTILALIMCSTFIDAFAAAGRTPGQFGVSGRGSAQYSIPIWTPPGIRNIQPSLSLTYDSHTSYGLMGPGWTLGGLSVIARCKPTYAQDSTPAPITLTPADGLCLDGNRLRATSTGVYQTEIADFSQVTASGVAGNGPSYFTVQGKDGLIYEYGNTADSKIIATGSSTPYLWALDKVTDRAGNYMLLTYSQTNGAFAPLSIRYTGSSGSTSLPYQVTFSYTTKSITDTLSQYVAGSTVQHTQQLSAITVSSSGTTVRAYNLAYGNSSTTSRAILTSIQECGGSAGTDCLAPTIVGYQQGTAGFATPNTPTGGATNSAVYSVDIDGDGRQDIVFGRYISATSSYEWWVQLATAAGYGAPINTGAVSTSNDYSYQHFLLDSFDGTSSNQILVPSGGIWYSYRWNGSVFVAASTGTAVQTAMISASADVDGDGLPDIVYITNNGSGYPAYIYVQLNTSSAAGISFVASPVMVSNLPTDTRDIIGNNMLPRSSVKHYDFDGDGRQDLIIITSKTGLNPQISPLELLSRYPAPFVLNTNIVTSQGIGGAILPVNWNDDGCTDLIVGVTLYLSQCNGALGSSYTFSSPPLLALDWDGDGRTDALATGATPGQQQNNTVALAAGPTTWQLYKSLGGAGPASVVSTTIPLNNTAQSIDISVVIDADGDGLDDVVGSIGDGSGNLYYGVHNGAFTPPDLATSFADGYGNSVQPTYAPIFQASFVWGDQVFPYQNYIGPLYIAVNAVFSDPSSTTAGATYYQHFYYAGASMNLQGRGFAGFGAQQRYDSRNGVWETWNRSRAFPYTGMLTSDIAAQDNLNATPINTLTNTLLSTTLDGTTHNQRYFPYVSNSVGQGHEVGGAKNGQLITTTATNYAFDNYGNATNVTTTSTDNDTGSPYYGRTWTSTAANTVTPNTGTWCLGLSTQITVTNGGSGVPSALTRTVGYTPDYTNCRETQRIVEPASATYRVTETYGFDAYGNPSSDQVTGVGMASRTTSINWGTGQFPTTISNPLGQVVTLGHDPNTGALTSQTDPNSLTMSWAYDDFARKVQENRPDRTYTLWTYYDCVDFGGCLVGPHALSLLHIDYNTDGSTKTTETQYFDPVDRQIMTYTVLLSGAYERNEKRFDSLGRVAQQAMPCVGGSLTSLCPYWTTYSYDMVNRLTVAQRPTSATNGTLQSTSYGYAGRTTSTTDALHNTAIRITQLTGAVGRSQDARGYSQQFSYDAFGSLLSVTDNASPANTLFTVGEYQYGIRGFPTSSTDMDLGARTYTYDALGEVTNGSDALGQSFSQTYDALSRPLNRTEADLTTNWTWGSTASSHNVGQLQSVSATSNDGTYTESYGYDGVARLASKSIAIPADTIYTYTYAYNAATGLLDTVQYPVSALGYQLALKYGYSNGLLASIADANNAATVFWSASATDARGHVTQEALGNGVVASHAFDAVTGWLNGIQAGVGGGAGLQNESYLFDLLGNVIQRQNNNVGLTENFYYDSLYRLDHSSLGGTTNLQMTYDAMGDITSRSDVAGGASWTYDATRRHAVLQAGNSSYSYDANGNAKTRNGYAILWSSYNYPTSINGNNKNISLFYGPDRQRYKQIYSSDSVTETTFSVGGLMEKVIVGGISDYRHYIRAGNELIAIVSRQSSGANAIHYVLSDHQGSVDRITDAGGALTIGESFSAFGARRDANTWSGTPTCPDLCTIKAITREGYTGQDAIGGVSMGLNHMNGRVQDAITGRFLSPDPHIPDPMNTQSFNRYSYVNNNPLTLTDPSGFESGCTDGGQGDISCVVNPDPAPLPAFPDPIVAPPGPSEGPAPSVPRPPVPKLPPIAPPPRPQPPVPQPPAQSQKPTSCPKGALANAANFLVNVGGSTVTAGTRTTQAGASIVLPSLVADALGAPAEPFTVFGALTMAVGSATTVTGQVIQGIGGLYLYSQGNPYPLQNAALQGVQTMTEDALKVPPLPGQDPSDSLVDRLSGENPCP